MTSDSSTHKADSSPLGFTNHDHNACVSETLDAAEARCEKEGLRFTSVRRKVLEILLQEHRALGAYTILDRLREDGFGSQPPVAYRALDFLVTNGLAHKIERLNAFIACAHPSHSHAPAFMICRLCDAVAETRSSPARGALGDVARATGFRIERTVVEAEGVCPSCIDKVDV
ncbi:Fur family transcriptional regulator [Pseudopelagicola sp. nBUS_19]|uniref:Fur family transcriptional regulator n=1 Tax=unclassified Pseudopelagicola TaxID=2649563 RepID=UPI003EB9BBE1